VATPIIIHTDAMEWQPSPSPGIDRKRLELEGQAEAGRVTSVVRYAAGSWFRSHPHPDGEEILVLDGVFSDERGDHPAGTYLLNPEGYSHAPRSADGCVLFVKLRQYPGVGRRQVRIDTSSGTWESYSGAGVWRQVLYAEPGYPETMHLLRLEAGVDVGPVAIASGEEIFVIDGRFSDEHGAYRPGSWIKLPPGSSHAPRSDDGCLLYVRKGSR
jgi:anti-sigma factor ChrR (cupin superfamily)